MNLLTPKHILLLQCAYGLALDWLDMMYDRPYVLDLQRWGLVGDDLRITTDGLFVLAEIDNLIAIPF